MPIRPYRQPRASRLLIATLCAGLSVALPVQAEEGWQIDLAPYLWLAGMEGDSRIGNGPVASIDMSPTDVLDLLDVGFMGSIEARNGRWGVFTDLVFARLSSSGSIAQVRGINGVSVDVDADIKSTTTQLAVTYRVQEGNSPVDLFLGGRYNQQEIDTRVTLNALGVINATISPEYSHSWWDPYIGARIVQPLSDDFALTAYGDVGGFNVGSDATWQMILGGTYRLSNSADATFGYRILDTDYADDGFDYDMRMSGVYAGASFHF